MERNNGSKSGDKNVTPEINVEQLLQENEMLKERLKELYFRYQQMENTWILTRLSFLFKVLEISDFDKECKEKALQEIKNSLFKKSEENEAEK